MERLDSLSLYELNLLREASRSRSLRGLARKLGKRPAHLSKALKKLESKLEAELFKRSASGISLAPDAMRLLPLVEEICELGEKLRFGHPSAKCEKQIAVSIAAVHFIQVRLCIPALKNLPRRYASKRFRFVEILPDDFRKRKSPRNPSSRLASHPKRNFPNGARNTSHEGTLRRFGTVFPAGL